MTAIDGLTAQPVEDMTASALAAHYRQLAELAVAMTGHLLRLAEVARHTDPTTYTDETLSVATAELLDSTAELRYALGDQMLAAGHIRRGRRA